MIDKSSGGRCAAVDLAHLAVVFHHSGATMRGSMQRTGRLIIPVFCLLAGASCLAHRDPTFRVVPGAPSYMLRSPDARKTPFPEILHAYNGSDPAQNWIDLRPRMELRIENAYYEKGASRRGLAGFLGTEVGRYGVTSDGLRLISFEPMSGRPETDLPVQHLISNPQTAFRFQRLYFEIVFSRKDNSHGSVLLGANSTQELDGLSAQLKDPETVCYQTSTHCTVFPEACTVSVEMEVVINEKPQTLVWGSLLASVVTEHPRSVNMKRLYAGRLVPVEIRANDPNALRMPLLPGDQVGWK